MNETQNKTHSKKTPTCMDKLRECLCFVFCCKKEQKFKPHDLDFNTLNTEILLNNSFIKIKAPDFDVSQFNGCSTSTFNIDSHIPRAFFSTLRRNPTLNNLLERDHTILSFENKLLPTPMQHDIAQESTAQQSMSQRILRQLKEKRKEQEQPNCMGLKIKKPQLLLANEAFNKEDNKPNNGPNDALGQ